MLTLLSGTVAGAIMGSRTAQLAGYHTAVSLDMGGTSTDIGLSVEADHVGFRAFDRVGARSAFRV